MSIARHFTMALEDLLKESQGQNAQLRVKIAELERQVADLVEIAQGIEIIEHGAGDTKEVWFLLRSDGKKIGAGSVRLTGTFAEAMSEYAKKRSAALAQAKKEGRNG